jgi:predicted O-methyltransferase YrrM
VNRFFQLKSFLRFYAAAQTRYQVHSPFVFDFAQAILDDQRWFYAFDDIEYHRGKLLHDQRNLNIRDLGAGSMVRTSATRTVADIARNSALSPFYCQVIFKLVQQYKPTRVLELGTSLGISAMYQAMAAPSGKIVTIEGCEDVATCARNHFRQLGIKNVELLEGDFDQQLPVALRKLGSIDLLLCDGNHRYEPTLRYFHACAKHAGQNAIFIFDDIHWSPEMEHAWAEIRAHPAVTLSIDLYRMGLVFFRKENLSKSHWSLVPWRWKPWQVW